MSTNFACAARLARISRCSSTTANGRACRASEQLVQLYNQQIANELGASQLYLSASIWAEQNELVGMAAYLRTEANEERSHALEFIDFAHKREFDVRLGALAAPPRGWDTVEDLWKAVLEAEKTNTEALKALHDAAIDDRDHALTGFLEPFHPLGL